MYIMITNIFFLLLEERPHNYTISTVSIIFRQEQYCTHKRKVWLYFQNLKSVSGQEWLLTTQMQEK